MADERPSQPRLLHYRVEYISPGGRSVAANYASPVPLERGQWIAVEGAYLVVERVIAAKRGDSTDGIALCKLTMG